MNNSLILENAYNTDYIYCLILSLFYSPSESLNKIINTDTEDCNTCYVQEYIKSKFIYPIHRNMSIERRVVSKLRLFLYNCGWLKKDSKSIIEKGKLDEFYSFLIHHMMNYGLGFIRVDQKNNVSDEKEVDIIRITDAHIEGDSKIMSLSKSVENWITSEVIEETKYNYKFESIPLLIPVYLDIRDPNTGLNKKYVNIMGGINFESIGDRLQKSFVWEIHSMICQTAEGGYYAVIHNNNGNWIGFSDNQIPSNWMVDMTDISGVKSLMHEVRFVFYKIQ